MRRPPVCIAVIIACLSCVPCFPEMVRLGQAGEAIVSLDADEGLSGLAITINGITFKPLAGAAVLDEDGKPDPSIPLQVTPRLADDVLTLAVTSSDPRARGLDPGAVEGLGEWRRLDLSRQAMPFGQTWWPKTTYSVKGDFWFTAHWVMEESSGTSWKAPNEGNHGTGPFPAALEIEYAPDTEGKYLPVREALELRFSRRLWDVVPMPRQRPSEYRKELADSVQVDFWGGKAAPELSHFLGIMKAIGRSRLRYLTILQNWQVGGFDALLPDSVWMPEYPPNVGVGTVQELRALCELGKSMGRFGFRTNYRVLRQNSPSLKRGLAHFAVDAEGKGLGYLRSSDWPSIAGRQETEIRGLFEPTASFTDQLTSGAAPGAWHDYGPGGSRSMAETLHRMQALARLIRHIHKGPLGSESLMDQQLLGEFVDSGDFAVMNGHERLVSPEFKLRRLHHLTTFHGMGLMYRFYEMPPFKRFHSSRTTFGSDQEQLDDYRACEILFGNGAYVCYPFANWRYYLTECLLVGHLQRHYAVQPVRRVLYWQEASPPDPLSVPERGSTALAKGSWVSLEELVRGGTVPNIVPWLPRTSEYGRIRVEYENGLTLVVNRLEGRFAVPDARPQGMTLPQYGWVAWKDDGSLVAFSADWPTTKHRVDYLRDDAAQIEYIDPRGAEIRGVSCITFWERGKPVITADPDRNELRIEGETMQLALPSPPPLSTLDFEFEDSLDGWRTPHGILAARLRRGALELAVISPDPQLYSPRLRLQGDDISALEIRMRASAGKLGQLYFATEEFENIAEDKVIRFEVIPDGEFHSYRLEVGKHAKWRGQTITAIRFDPVHGPEEAEVAIDYIRAIP